MRDPNRITRILKSLALYWRQNPDMRLGQIVENTRTEDDPGGTMFYVEDAIIERGLAMVVPEFVASEDIEIRQWRPPSVGGQQVGCPNLQVVAIHKPTGIAVLVDDERSMMKCKAVAIERLKELLALHGTEPWEWKP